MSPGKRPEAPAPANSSGAWVGRFALCIAFSCACGPIVKRARFSQRPDTVRPGSPLGPFAGRVEDRSTGKPIEDALVQGTWFFARGVGSPTSYETRTHQTQTDPDGRYEIPQLRSLPQGLSARLERFTLLVYRRDYVAYRNNRVFGGGTRRIDFTQYDNTVALTRWDPELSRARHLLFTGGHAAFRAATVWERTEASRELDRLHDSSADSEPLEPVASADLSPAADDATVAEQLGEAGRLLLAEDVRRITGFSGEFRRQVLSDPGDSTSSLHLRAVDRPERFDVAIRVWRLPADEMRKKYDELLESLPEAKATSDVGQRGFTTSQGEILGICLLDKAGDAIALITCGRGQCSSPDQLLEMARLAEQRLADETATPPSPEELLPLDDASE